MGEIELYGVYIPILLVQAILAFIFYKVVTLATDRLIAKGWIGFPSLFNLCLYVLLLMVTHWLFLLAQRV